MESILIILHVFVCLFLVLVILLQPGKTPGMGSAFGGSAGAGNFGAKSPVTILSKITVALAFFFMLSSLTLAFLSVRDHQVMIDLAEETHHPTPGLEFPADEPAAQEPIEVETVPADPPAIDVEGTDDG